MSQSKEQKALYQAMTQLIAKMQDPKTNPAQEALTSSALDAARVLQTGEYSTLPKGMFFNMEDPAQQLKRYKTLSNVNQGGTFALGKNSGGGRTQASDLQSKFLGDKFARDVGQTRQNDVRNAWGNVNNALQQASGYQTNNNSQIFGALQGQYANAPKGFSWSSLIGPLAGIAGAAI